MDLPVGESLHLLGDGVAVPFALAEGERPEPTLGDFQAGLYMTRFFSELVLSAGADGTLEPFAEELPEPIVDS